MGPHRRPSRTNKTKFTLADRLLAEAVRISERDESTVLREDDAVKLARVAGGSLEERIIHRASAHEHNSQLSEALQHIKLAMGWLIGICTGLVLLAGAGAARGALGNDPIEPVNFFWVISSLLGVQTLLLLLWIIIMLLPAPGGRGGLMGMASLGGIVLGIGRKIGMRLYRNSQHAVAVEANATMLARGDLGRWTFSAVSHGLWLAFNVGCLLLVIILLSVKHYEFCWQTTILNEHFYQPITRIIGTLPELVGFQVPTDEQVAASRWPGSPTDVPGSPSGIVDAKDAWSSLLVGCLVLYGFAPRVLLLGYSLSRRRAAGRRIRLDTSLPGYMRLEPLLMPSQSLAPTADSVDSGISTIGSEAPISPQVRESSRPEGPPCIFALELPTQSPHTSWLPCSTEIEWRDLGMVDGRDDRHRVQRQLTEGEHEPKCVVAVCSLTTTPDRGIAGFLSIVQQSVVNPVMLVLTDGHALRQRSDGENLESRLADWQAVAAASGIDNEHVVEIDLDHLTDQSIGLLRQLAQGDDVPAPQSMHKLPQTFEIIVKRADAWWSKSTAPTQEEQVQLHHDIAGLYRNRISQWRRFIDSPQEATVDLSQRLRDGAERAVTLIPKRWKAQPKWLAAGATAGALGCIAAATWFTPAAIAALPMWSGVGAAVGAAFGFKLTGKDDTELSEDEVQDLAGEISAALRSAVVFALLLELQGRGEAVITRVLDGVIDPEETQTWANSQEVQTWLGHVSTRFNDVLAREVN